MKLSGHKTESIYRRYAVTAENDLAEAVAKVAGQLEADRKAAKGRKVVAIGDKTGTEPVPSRQETLKSRVN